MEWKNIICEKECTGCMACKNICPKNAITMEENDEGFKYPKIDLDICVKCGLCKKVCPINHKLDENKNEIKAYCCKNKDDKVRMKSSSGGIFTLIAESILEQNGVVFGARFDESFNVIHDYIEKKEDLYFFRGSKYVQSNIGNTYQKVREFLNIGRKVLFTGTPCQIEGLLTFLQKDYDNLYTQDIICHGVPSPKVWKRYLKYKEELNTKQLRNVEFRKKDILGWSNFQMSYQYEETEENVHHDDDPYMKLFLRNVILRKSCYQCQFKKIKRKSDITLADFWGINEIKPEINDDKGVSAILINSKKGNELFRAIINKIEFCEVKIEDIAKHNSPICQSVYYNENREEFFKELNSGENFQKLVEKFLENDKI